MSPQSFDDPKRLARQRDAAVALAFFTASWLAAVYLLPAIAGAASMSSAAIGALAWAAVGKSFVMVVALFVVAALLDQVLQRHYFR